MQRSPTTTDPYRLYRRIFALAVLGAVIIVLWVVREALYPYLVGILLAFALAPALRFIERHIPGGSKRADLRRFAAVLLLYALFFGLLIVFAITVGRWIADETTELMDSLPDHWDQLKSRYDNVHTWYVDNVPEQMRDSIDSSIQSWSATASNWVSTPITIFLDSISGVFGLLATLFFIPMFMFYVLLERPVGGESIQRAIPDAWRTDISAVLSIIRTQFVAYFRGISMEGIILGGITAIAFWLIGVPHAIGLGALTGLAVFIPYVGFWFAFIATIIVVMANEPTLLVPVLVISGVFQIIDNWYLSPRFKGESIGFTPAQTLFILAIAFALIGPIGVIIGTPIAAVLRELVAYIYRRLSPPQDEEALDEEQATPDALASASVPD